MIQARTNLSIVRDLFCGYGGKKKLITSKFVQAKFTVFLGIRVQLALQQPYSSACVSVYTANPLFQGFTVRL